ncbi:PREDICTED: tumor necrosis factor receptor superfamily member 1B-like isoform X3 [Acropora digitifera]|uniref:tumor necrosis factor receptor superfamily member 1B-like isoform X3 n=1 Tax=Acropora digitifera TaxID=70779 RepID=UPI00077A7F08|nr:PREDICTED: tumor necrosis factor receptor superfamily member 1B-like isoform X3 [Acropora digitifera]
MPLFRVVFLLCFVVLRSVPLAAKCPQAHFWNGTSCNRCSGCPVGQGVKTNCSQSRDTICQKCVLDFDYSNSSGMEACKGCDQDSNCLPGNPKVIQKCTVTSPRVCDGCEDGFFLNLFAGEEGGGCMECSPSCSENEIETQSCNTKHDRVCSKRPSTTEKTSTNRPRQTDWRIVSILKRTDFSATLSKDTNDTLKVSTSPFPVLHKETEDDGGSEPQKTTERSETTDLPVYEKPWLWAIGAFPVVIIALPIVIVTAVRYRQDSNEKSHDPVEDDQLIHRPRGQPRPRGLDQTIRSIEVEGRSFIAERLNEKDSQDYWFFLRVAEKLGISKECRGFTSLRNPTEAFLQLYSEREGSTLRAVVGALRECGLTLIASEIETEFASVQETEELKAADMDESIV